MICFFFFFFATDLTDDGENCTNCQTGKLKNTTVDYKATLRDGDSVTVPNLNFKECASCGDAVFPAEAARRIDQAVLDHTEPLTLEELKKVRKLLESNKTLLAESLGLGSKTWLRWESGEQSISRSMSYFIRAMAEFPEAYKWVAQRGWRKK